MPENHFGEQVAAAYDTASSRVFAPEVVGPVVELLTREAAGGAALELGIGTGRIALPLARRGVQVHGIDLSPEMLGRLRTKPDGDTIAVTVGDFATTYLGESFAVVYLLFNTIMNLTTQGEQVACFRNAARHLEPGGRFVVEVMAPALQRLPPGETIRAFDVAGDRLGFDEYDVASQGLVSHQYAIGDGVLEVQRTPFRYVWPAELDLMAQLAGMTLRQRWGGWHREPFTSDSALHVSVYEKGI